ncbi:MAG: GNAT family N-acetyltransferase [Planctomycetota bacterium]
MALTTHENGNPPSIAPDELRIESMPAEHAFAGHREAWTGVVRELGLHLSLGPDWVRAAAVAHGQWDGMRTLVAWRGDEPVAFVPFRICVERMWGISVRSLDLGGNLVAYHHEFAARECHEDLLRHLTSMGGWDLLRALNLNGSGATHRALLAAAQGSMTAVTYPDAEIPFLPVAGSWDDFLKDCGRKLRKNVKRNERKIESRNVEIERFTVPEHVPRLLDAMVAIEAASWKAEAGFAITERPVEVEYYRALLPQLASMGALRGIVANLDGKPIAYNLSASWNGQYGDLKTTYSAEFKDLAPGWYVRRMAIQDAHDEGVAEFDFLGPAEAHKLQWTKSVRRHVNVFLFGPSLRGRALGFLKRRVQARREAAASADDAGE